MFEVRVFQYVPYMNPDDPEDAEDTGKSIEYCAGSFDALHMAKIFKDKLESEIAQENGFVANRFTPQVKIFEVKTVKEELKD